MVSKVRLKNSGRGSQRPSGHMGLDPWAKWALPEDCWTLQQSELNINENSRFNVLFRGRGHKLFWAEKPSARTRTLKMIRSRLMLVQGVVSNRKSVNSMRPFYFKSLVPVPWHPMF